MCCLTVNHPAPRVVDAGLAAWLAGPRSRERSRGPGVFVYPFTAMCATEQRTGRNRLPTKSFKNKEKSIVLQLNVKVSLYCS